MIFTKASLILAVVSFTAIFCAQSAAGAARGPKITHKIYFDIQHGDQPMGRSAFILLRCLSNLGLMNSTVVMGLFGGVRCSGLLGVSWLNQSMFYRRYLKPRRTSVLWQLVSRRMALSLTMVTKAPSSTA